MSDDEKKAARELQVFEDFISRSGLPIDRQSIRKCDPPEPDILCKVSGEYVAFELAEVQSLLQPPPFSLAPNDSRSVLAVKGSLRRFAPWTAPGRSEGMTVYEGKGGMQISASDFVSHLILFDSIAPQTRAFGPCGRAERNLSAIPDA